LCLKQQKQRFSVFHVGQPHKYTNYIFSGRKKNCLQSERTALNLN
jgi:hypothetical protein